MREFMNLIESWYDDEDEGDGSWTPDTYELRAGTIVYHGTNMDFDESYLSSPVWVSRSMEVAKYFATWHEGDGEPRIAKYTLTRDMKLCLIGGKHDLESLSEYYGVETGDPESMADSFSRIMSDFDGWIIPTNYPNGDDIMLSDTSHLEYVETKTLDEL